MINYSNNKEFVMVIECEMLWKGSLVIKKTYKIFNYLRCNIGYIMEFVKE